MEAIIGENRETIALLVVCLAVTSGNIWLHRDSPPVNWEITEQYGITFSHPPGFRFTSTVPATWTLGYWDGGVQGEPTSGGFEVIGMFWVTDKADTLELAIDFVLDLAKEENPGLSVQTIKSMIFDEREVAYGNVILGAEGMPVPGVVYAFRDSYGRIILPYHLRYPGSFEYSENVVKQIIRSIEVSPPESPRELPAYWPTYGWRYASPEERGMDSSKLQEMVEAIESYPSSVKVDSVLVVKNGYIVFEEYFNDYTKDTPHIVYSCTKSVVSTIFGIAHENGAIPSLDTKLLDIFPDRSPANLDEWKESITLRNILMMSAGFDARDSWIYEWEKLDDLHSASDAVGYTLDLSMAFEPGSRFEYTNAVSHLLSCIITEKTGVSAAEYGQEYLFDPLGITLHQWDADNLGRNWGYNRIYFTPHDMAKLGYLFLNEGKWDGEQIISSDWVKEATMHRIDANLIEGYGYQWWVGDGFYTALGYMGQFIMVFPEHDMIVVLTGGTPETYDYNIRLPSQYILPAIN
jgi:CubicO group peptidase (beta-lactamase class C family)